MRKSVLFATAAMGLLLSACETTSPAQQRAMDDAKCKSFGFRRNTDGFARCLQDIDLNRSADRRVRQEELYMWSGPRFYGAPYSRYW
jgi:hypothetical protein